MHEIRNLNLHSLQNRDSMKIINGWVVFILEEALLQNLWFLRDDLGPVNRSLRYAN